MRGDNSESVIKMDASVRVPRLFSDYLDIAQTTQTLKKQERQSEYSSLRGAVRPFLFLKKKDLWMLRKETG